ncbi:MAG TPA: iron ABC transporter permease [Ilumatobacter sp.]|jgi:iron(III) transport system permease protein|nr:iron ABC transporter permease [Ilumatobacter sp.]
MSDGARAPALRRHWLDRPGWALLALVAAALVVVPVAMLVTGILRPDTQMWRAQWDTRLPHQIVATLTLLIGVIGVSTVLGVSLAWLVSAYTFPGRRVLGWALVLPLAMPGYILGFVTLSVFGVAGPIQTWWRDQFGRDAWFPEIRSMPFAILTLSLTLYPYVYLMARAALRDQAATAQLVARTLGASRAEATRRVVLPLLRPAIAAGAAVVAMETLTDFGTVQYFNVETVTVGLFRIWRGTYDREAASEIASLVLLFALLAIGAERVLRGRARFGQSGGRGAGVEPRRLRGLKAAGATLACGSVMTVAFIAPVLQLAKWAIDEQTGPRGTPMVREYQGFLRNSLVLATTTTVVCVVVAALITNARRFGNQRLVGSANRLSAVGYAVPGPVVGMGVVVALVALDDRLESIGLDLPGAIATGSFLALAYAYAVRFLAPATASVEAGLGNVSDEMTASARTLGASPMRVLSRIHLPLSRASMLTAALLVGVDALKELPLAYLLRPVGFDTLPVWVYNLASESRFQQAALPALTIIAVATIPVIVLSRQLDKPRS